MDIVERKNHFKKLAKWETEIPKVGGQSCGIQYLKTWLICEEIDFEICIHYHRSQLKNKQIMWALFDLYLDDIIK